VPLVIEAKDWGTAFTWPNHGFRNHGCDHRQVGVVRRDPFAMLPFCGYHFGDYFKHWLGVGPNSSSRRGFSASTGSAATRTAVPVADSARICAC